MLFKNETLIEKYSQGDPQVVFLISTDPKRGVREADRIVEKEWITESTGVYDSIEVFTTLEDAQKYLEFISYMPVEHFILEGVGLPEDVVVACESGWNGNPDKEPYKEYTCVSVGYSKVDIKGIV